MTEEKKGAIQKWGEKINWDQRVKAVCKPCWELKYCPYGPLVEEFPLPEESSHRSCRIFGHECPVFTVAEPFTETRELRNITRHIPRPVQFRVLKRENQVCRSCGMPVADNDIHFDHIIPWSKGGPTEESNIQLLCGPCNLKKSDRYEEQFLIKELNDHISEPVDTSILKFLLLVAEIRHDFFGRNNRIPDADDIAIECNNGVKGEAEEHGAQIIVDLDQVFLKQKPTDIPKDIYEALKFRWGYKDGKVRKLQKAAAEIGIAVDIFLEAEIEFVEKLGWRVKDTSGERKKWLRT